MQTMQAVADTKALGCQWQTVAKRGRPLRSMQPDQDRRMVGEGTRSSCSSRPQSRASEHKPLREQLGTSTARLVTESECHHAGVQHASPRQKCLSKRRTSATTSCPADGGTATHLHGLLSRLPAPSPAISRTDAKHDVTTPPAGGRAGANASANR